MQPMNSNCTITAMGSYVPARTMTNFDLEKLVDTTNEWILQRTGIAERRIAHENEFTSHLIYHAIDDMLKRYPVTLQDVDYIIVATSTPDTIFPSMAAGVQSKYGIKSCGAVDIQAACAGFTTGLQLANSLLISNSYKKILVIGADALSKITDYTDRTTCILFGDGAGVVLLEHAEDEVGDILTAYSHTNGSEGHQLYLNNLTDHIGDHVIQTNGHLVQNGREVYRWAISQVAEGVIDLMEKGDRTSNEIDWFVPHSANRRIIETLCGKTGFNEEQVLTSITYHGNTSAASIPLSLHEAVKDGRLRPGHILLLHGFGGGLTQAGVILRWKLQS